MNWIAQNLWTVGISTFVFAHEERRCEQMRRQKLLELNEDSKHIQISVHWSVSGHVYASVFSVCQCAQPAMFCTLSEQLSKTNGPHAAAVSCLSPCQV